MEACLAAGAKAAALAIREAKTANFMVADTNTVILCEGFGVGVVASRDLAIFTLQSSTKTETANATQTLSCLILCQ